ncbi:ketopantoate hydroxymethyltransferase-domain-containing protein [Dipodascopsis uninucleata]
MFSYGTLVHKVALSHLGKYTRNGLLGLQIWTCLGRKNYSSRPVESSSEKSKTARSKVTLNTISSLYRKKIPITSLTAHDYPSGILVDRAGIDIALVGDSLAMVALGYNNTNKLTIDEMLHHCRAVARGCKNAFLVGDMTFGSYEESPGQAIRSAVRLIQEGGVEAVKLEGGIEMADTIRAITTAGIPVMGHIGLTPQRSTSLGGFRVQGRTADQVKNIVQSARALQDAGCFAIVVEAVPSQVANVITKSVQIPTIGIGAGKECSGQVLVQLDMLGYFDRFTPKFVKKYDEGYEHGLKAIEAYISEVRSGRFPAEEHTYAMKNEEQSSKLAELEESLTKLA